MTGLQTCNTGLIEIFVKVNSAVIFNHLVHVSESTSKYPMRRI